MPRFHRVPKFDEDGKWVGDERVQFTQEEEDARDAEEAAELAERPMREWLKQIAKTDKDMPRWFEDAVDEGSIALKAGRVKDNYDAKKVLRGQKP